MAGRPPSLNRLQTGTRSRTVKTLLAPARSEIEQQVLTDLGGDQDGLPTTLGRLVQVFSEVTLLRQVLFQRMEGQPLTNKGKARAMFAAYLQLVDREHRLAQAIGLERRARKLPTLNDYLDGRAVERS
jgi:hypothetical protein